MSTTPKNNVRDLGSFDDLIAQRKESTGGDGTTFVFPGFGRDWHLAAPGLQTAEWNDDFTNLHVDLRDGLIDMPAYRVELAALILGDESDDFLAVCDKEGFDAAQLLTAAIAKFNQDAEANPTRGNSRNTRGRAKRR